MECRQAADLMLEWTTIDVADALELLSPDFRNPEVMNQSQSQIGLTDIPPLFYSCR